MRLSVGPLALLSSIFLFLTRFRSVRGDCSKNFVWYIRVSFLFWLNLKPYFTCVALWLEWIFSFKADKFWLLPFLLTGSRVSFEDLSPNEKRLFQRAVASGELSKMIEPWDPWWLKPSARTLSLSPDGTQLVQPLIKQETTVSSEYDPESKQTNEIPPGPETPLQPVNKLISTEPSPLLTVHLVDILYSYCFTLRIYNGDWRSDAVESAMVLLSISYVLGQAAQPETVSEALSHSLEQTCSPAYRHLGGLQFGLGLLDDVIALLSLGSPALVCSLCDLQRLMQAGERELKMGMPRKLKKPDAISRLKQAERKIYFIMCWVHEQPDQTWASLAAIVKAEKASALDFVTSQRSDKIEDQSKSRGKILIEEVQ